MKFDFDTDQDAMAAALANHGATFILVPLADAIVEASKAHNLNESVLAGGFEMKHIILLTRV